MVNQQTLSGNWNELKGKLRKKWGQLTNDDMQTFNGNVDQLIGMIQSKTGEARQSIEKYLDELTSSGASGVAQATEAVRDFATGAASQAREYANQAAGAVEWGSQQAMDAARQGYRQYERSVRSRPVESVAICFGIGVLTGLFVGLALRSR